MTRIRTICWLAGIVSVSVPIYALLGTVRLGLAGAAYFFAQLEPARRRRIFEISPSRVALMSLLLVGILVLNLPLLGVLR